MVRGLAFDTSGRMRSMSLQRSSRASSNQSGSTARSVVQCSSGSGGLTAGLPGCARWLTTYINGTVVGCAGAGTCTQRGTAATLAPCDVNSLGAGRATRHGTAQCDWAVECDSPVWTDRQFTTDAWRANHGWLRIEQADRHERHAELPQRALRYSRAAPLPPSPPIPVSIRWRSPNEFLFPSATARCGERCRSLAPAPGTWLRPRALAYAQTRRKVREIDGAAE